jgi:hypothetical protein
MTKEYKNKNLDRGQISVCLTEFGVKNCSYTHVSGSQYHLRGTYEGKDVLINVFENKDGSTSIGHAAGRDRELFELLADEVVRRCAYSEEVRLELSIPDFSDENLRNLFAYLESEGAKVGDRRELEYGGTQSRWIGPQGDAVVVKGFKNGTVQFQGKNAHVASLIWDYLYNVLSLEDAIAKQSKVYNVDITVAEIKSELAARIPVAHSFIEDVVRKQLSSALMLCKMAVPLEDYGAVAFPALRGLEGFIKQVLCKGGLKPADKQNIGEYFEQNKVIGHFALRSDYAAHVGDTCTRVLGDSYTLYFNQRHGVFHMDASIEASRILGSLEDAKRIVFEVFESIEVSSKSLCS